MHIQKTVSIVEPTTYQIAFGHEGELEVTDARTPLDNLIEREEAPSLEEAELNDARNEALRRLLLFCFGESKNMLEALKQLSIICILGMPSPDT